MSATRLISASVVPVVLLALPGAARGQQTEPRDPYAGNACVRCHANLPGRLGAITVSEWRDSVHHAHGVACDGCHGGNAALRPEEFDSAEAFKNASHLARDPRFLTFQNGTDRFVSRVRGREVSYFCGKCHAVVKEKHLGSPHGDNGDPTCLYCHSRTPDGRATHRIGTSTLQIIDLRDRDQGGRCAVCHQAATMETVRQIRETLQRTTDLIDQASDDYEHLAEHGYRSLELTGLREHGIEVHSRLRRVFHSFNMGEISGFAGEIQALSERTARTRSLLEQVQEMRRRQTLVGLGVCAFLLCFVAVLLHYKHRYCLRHAAHEQAPT